MSPIRTTTFERVNEVIVRQGDVFVMSIDTIPENVMPTERDGGSVVLAYGEQTGHKHQIADPGAELFSAPDTEDRFLKIMNASGVFLKHEEHATIYFPPGNYVVRQQREFTSADMPSIRVAD